MACFGAFLAGAGPPRGRIRTPCIFWVRFSSGIVQIGALRGHPCLFACFATWAPSAWEPPPCVGHADEDPHMSQYRLNLTADDRNADPFQGGLRFGPAPGPDPGPGPQPPAPGPGSGPGPWARARAPGPTPGLSFLLGPFLNESKPSPNLHQHLTKISPKSNKNLTKI